MIIDIYSHACPSDFIEGLQAHYPTLESSGLQRRPLLYDADARVRFMDDHGIDIQVLVLVRPPLWLGMPREIMYRLVRCAHESIATMVATWPDRFIGVAVAPRVDDRILDEVRYAWNELGLTGVQVFTNIEGAPVDTAEMWALYAEAASAAQPIWIHPQHNPYAYPWLKESLLDRSLAWPFDTAVAMARLVYAGVLDRYPQLTFITHHLGGMIPHFAARLESFDEEIEDFTRDGLNTAGSVSLQRPIGEYLRSFYGDTAINYGPAALECGIRFFGLDHVAFGTDFPMGADDGTRWTGQILSALAEALPDLGQRQRVLGSTGQHLLGLG
jgi:predicted TIM-barrel fold metal-dependent hydrolase